MKEFKDGQLKSIKELEPLDEGQDDRIIQGLVTGTGDIEHYDKFIVLKCKKCKNELQLDNEGDFRHFDIDTKCHECNSTMVVIQNTKGRVRKILLQEDTIEKPTEITSFLFGEDTLIVDDGQKIAVRGTLRSVKRHKNDVTYQRVFDVNKVRLSQRKKLIPSQLEIEKFMQTDKEDIISSFAPNIKGMELTKEAILIACIGGVDSQDIRGDINVFIVGDPGTAKTKILQFILKVIEPSAYASGRSASAAGLLAGVDNLSDGTRIARIGPIPRCSGGVVALDEMDKMNARDRSALHESMETQKFSLIKIGINRVMECKTVIIGAANAYGGNKWDSSISIIDNVRLPDSLLSRFGLIILVLDVPDSKMDLAIARHIIKARQHKIEAKLSEEDLMKFINYAKSFKPQISEEAGNTILNWWSKLRLESQPDKSPMVDNRTLEDLNRMTEAYAKFRFCSIATSDDAHDAIRLLQDSLHSLGMNTPGERAEANVHTMNKQEYLQHIFKQPISETQAILELLKKQKWWDSEEKARNEIDKLRTASLLIEKLDGIQWVN